MKITARSLLRGSVAAGLTLGTVLSASPAKAAACLVDFDHRFSLYNLYAQARNTFAIKTAYSASAPLHSVPCADAPDQEAAGNCYYYREPCTGIATGSIYVDDDSGLDHYHLVFSNPGFGEADIQACGFVNPDGVGSGFRKRVNNQCITPTWNEEPRSLMSHLASQWIKVSRVSAAGSLPFKITRINVGGDTPIQLWFRSTGGAWYSWSSLAPGNHNLSMPSAANLVRIRAAEGETGPYEILDFNVEML
ncbi:hypothetical protein [Sorangium sp. So ce1078]|uniref:hypothetical protein n=1 Tax=Sorangium sp. So ce1078 TaxID=3133329 RepID=UPI003F5F1857